MAIVEKSDGSSNILKFEPNEVEASVAALRDALGEWQPPTNKRWCELANPLLPAARLAWLTVHKSRPEMRKVVKGLSDSNNLGELMYQLAWAGDYFAKMARLCAVAEDRLCLHGALPAETDWREPVVLA